VATFLLLTGFVNALKPIKLARSGRSDVALGSLASSAFRRTLRLMLPCTVATIMSWALCQLGGYEIGRLVESEWMSYTSPPRSTTLFGIASDLIQAIYATWARADNIYDKNQWTMEWFLKGSMVLFVTLLATVKATAKYRMLIFLVLFLYSWESMDAMIGLPIYGGALLAELNFEPCISKFTTSRHPVKRALPFSMVLLGWYLMSYPGVHTEWAPWSNALLQVGVHIFPAGSDVYSFWCTVGVFLITGGVLLSSTLQRFLSHPYFLWLGANSFPIYLLHGPLLRSVLNWMVFLFVQPNWHEDVDDDGVVVRVYPTLPIPAAWRFALAIPVFFFVLLVAAHRWTMKIEPWCGAVTKSLEERVCGVKKEAEIPILNGQVPERREEAIRLLNGNGSILPT
jgi:peptidoglycan/LPS O-acetylase OafA/YrhL